MSSSRLGLCVALLLCPSLSACADRPSVSLIEDAVRKRLDGGSEQRIKLASLTKTDGQEGQLLGEKIYELKFKGVAKFTAAAFYSTGNAMSGPEVYISTTPITSTPKSCGQDLSMCLSAMPVQAKKGDELALTGEADFEKSESGWHVSSVHLETASRR
jgi:hypothetical protein